MTMRYGAVLLLTLGVVSSALGVVYTKHLSRQLFMQSQVLDAIRDKLNIEWGKLQLEQSTWAAPTRVAEIARKRLAMEVPPPGKIIITMP